MRHIREDRKQREITYRRETEKRREKVERGHVGLK